MAGETGYAAFFLVSGHEILKNRSSCSTQGNAYTSNQRPIGLAVFRSVVGLWLNPSSQQFLTGQSQLCSTQPSSCVARAAYCQPANQPWRLAWESLWGGTEGTPATFSVGPTSYQWVLLSWRPGHLLIWLPQFQSQMWSGAREGRSPPHNAPNLCFLVLILKAQAFHVGVV